MLVFKYFANSIAKSVFPLAVGPIKAITKGSEESIIKNFKRNFSGFFNQEIKKCIYLKPFINTNVKFKSIPFK